MLRKHCKWVFVIGLVVASASSHAQIILSNTSYFQDFNTLGSGVTNPWNQSSTIAGWEAFRKPGSTWNAVTAYKSNPGNAMNYGLYSLGSDALDRGLGARPHSGDNGSFMYGTGFQNDLGSTITSITISFRAEVWWKTATDSTQTLEFQYNTEESGVNASQGWVTSQPLSFSWTNTIAGGTGHVDGNSVGSMMSATISGLSIAQGEELWLRWLDIDDAVADFGMGIDDFSISFETASAGPVPEPATITLAASAAALAIRRKRRAKQLLSS